MENVVEDILKQYFECIQKRDYENFFPFLLNDFSEKISDNDLDFIFGKKTKNYSDYEIIGFDLKSLSDSFYKNGNYFFKLDYTFDLKNTNTSRITTEKSCVILLWSEIENKIYFIPYLEHKKTIIYPLIPNSLANEFLKGNNISYKAELIPYPDFEQVFVEETNPLAKYVFIPLVTIKIQNHEIFGDKTFHIIAIWDTGNYEKDYLGEYRKDVNEITFDIVGEKLAYKDDMKFPKIEYLEQAYNLIVEDFEKQKDYYLENLESQTKRAKMERGKELIIEKIPEFGEFEAEYYFERITSVLLSKYRYKKYGAVNSLFDDNSYYAYKITKGKYTDDELNCLDFNKIGKVNLVDNLLLLPNFIQNDEHPINSIFIGQVDEWDYISASSTTTYLFYDKANKKQIQIFQWD